MNATICTRFCQRCGWKRIDEVELDLLNIVLGAVELELVKKIGVVVTIKVGLFEVTGSGLLVKVENISVVGILLVDFVLD